MPDAGVSADPQRRHRILSGVEDAAVVPLVAVVDPPGWQVAALLPTPTGSGAAPMTALPQAPYTVLGRGPMHREHTHQAGPTATVQR